jgi:V8-like Glu-specific endopeptidase
LASASHFLSLIRQGQAASRTIESAGGLESTKPDALPARSDLIEQLRREIDYTIRKTGIEIDANAIEKLTSEADDGLRVLFDQGPNAKLDERLTSGLEAVVKTDGSRPVLFVEDDFVDVLQPSIGRYATVLSRMENAVRQVCASVGRVDDPNAPPLRYQGTCFVIADGIVVTNRHVHDAITSAGALNPGVFIDFAREVGKTRTDRRFPIKRVVRVGEKGSSEFDNEFDLNFSGLDMAVLELTPVAGQKFPPPLPVARGDDPATKGALAAAGRAVYLVGYPGNEQSTTADLFSKIFSGVKAFKRLAPGEIMDDPGTLDRDPHGWVMTHDASTLGGNSGSGVVDLELSGNTLLGLHFAGLHKQRNWAHAFEKFSEVISDLLPKPTAKP